MGAETMAEYPANLAGVPDAPGKIARYKNEMGLIVGKPVFDAVVLSSSWVVMRLKLQQDGRPLRSPCREKSLCGLRARRGLYLGR